MMAVACNLLKDFLNMREIVVKEIAFDTDTGEPKAIPVVETIDVLAFLASQTFDNYQPCHIEVLPPALITLGSN
jgi:hypothetical protein